MKIVTVIGARPQFVKAAVISRELSLRKDTSEVIVHTGQHFDRNMSDIFFEEMRIPKPHYNLEINLLSHGAMTGRMMEGIEGILNKERPDYVLVYGDTNSTLAGALAAKKLSIKVAHVEAGLRSFNMKMPEEINRILTDRISDILFCPTDNAVKNLQNEGFDNFGCRVVKSGDVMQDAALFYASEARKPDFALPDDFILATVHRAENTDDPNLLLEITTALNRISQETPVVMPVHPRTKKLFETYGIKTGFTLVEPVGYLEMIYLLKQCRLVMTDSGGLQKEAFFFSRHCLTLRKETEWVELVENGFNTLAGTDSQKIYTEYKKAMDRKADFSLNLYGGGRAGSVISSALLEDHRA